MRTNTIQAVFIIVLWSFAVHLPGLFSLPARAGMEFPIYNFLLARAYKVFGVHDIFGRLLSMVFAAWGAVYLYLFVKRRLGERIALWSALVMCVIPVHLYFTLTVQPDPMALWGLLGFAYYGDRWLFTHWQGTAWFCAVLSGALASYLKLPYLYILGPLWVILGYERFGRKFVKNIAWWAALLGLCIAAGAMSSHLAHLAPVLTRQFWQGQFISRIPEWVMTYAGFLFALIGFYYYRKAKTFTFFTAWLVVCAVYVVLIGEYGLSHGEILLPLAPMAAVWIACGMTAFWEHTKGAFLTKAVAIMLILGIPAQTALLMARLYRVP